MFIENRKPDSPGGVRKWAVNLAVPLAFASGVLVLASAATFVFQLEHHAAVLCVVLLWVSLFSHFLAWTLLAIRVLAQAISPHEENEALVLSSAVSSIWLAVTGLLWFFAFIAWMN